LEKRKRGKENQFQQPCGPLEKLPATLQKISSPLQRSALQGVSVFFVWYFS